MFQVIFPYTAGVYPFKRQEEDPTRMFAGEGGPGTNQSQVHYVSLDMPANRLSTAFDSVTLFYGEDPDYPSGIFMVKLETAVSVFCSLMMQKLYSGFDLCNPKLL